MTGRAFAAALLIAAPALFGQYTYYYTDQLTSYNPSDWTLNGVTGFGPGGMTTQSSYGGSAIYVPYASSYSEVKTTLTLTHSGGSYITYLLASSNALSGPLASGTAYAFEVQNPTFSGSSCSATLAGYKIISGSVTALASTTIPCSNGMTVRAVYTTHS